MIHRYLFAICTLLPASVVAQEIGTIVSSGVASTATGTSASNTAIGPVYTTPPVMSAAEQAAFEARLSSMNRSTPIPDVPLLPVLPPSSPPSEPSGLRTTQLNAAAATTPMATTDFTFQRQHQFTLSETGPSTSTTGESSLGSMGNNTIFYAANWFAARSANAGASFTFVSPSTTFPSINGGFCCDQVVHYAPAQDMMLWALLYSKDNSTGTLRIAKAVGAANVAANSWTFNDFNPQMFGFPNGNWMDFPNMTVGATFLYVTANVFTTSNNSFTGSVIFRIPLAQLAAGGQVTFNSFTSTNFGSWRCTDGAGTTMYCGTHVGGNRIRILRWDDSSANTAFNDVQLSGFTYLQGGDGIAFSPDGTNWADDADRRILGAWVSGGVIGFMFPAKQDATFPYPYTIVARFNESNRTLISQDTIWSSSFAWLYPSVAVNASGNLAGVIAFGGGQFYPNEAAWIADDVHPGFTPFESYPATNGNHGPTSNRWGDFLTARRSSASPNTWVSGAYDLRNGGSNSSVVQSFLWYGRARDFAGPDLTITKTHSGNFRQGQTGATYTITVSNSGGGPTTGSVSITDTVPFGLTATSIGGTGWSCSQPSGPCSRSDTLAGGASYPPLTLTVNVSAAAAATVTNTAFVSGGGETNTANDTAADATTVDPGTGADLTITKTHTGNFTQGQMSATYSLIVRNNGNGSSFGTVTVTDTLPLGLTAAFISGQGWSCAQPAGPCTRTDALAAGLVYPAITLSVNVAANASANVTNTAAVDGGGETNPNNNTVADPTTIAQAVSPDLTIAKTHAGNFTPGQTGAVYTITVGNAGAGATNGIVSVIDTLPGGLTATSISGIGWNCTQPAGPCTRGDSLAGGVNYPSITLTVNVLNTAANVVNTATVAGGSDSNPANNTASDPTVIVPATPVITSTSPNPVLGIDANQTLFINGSGFQNGPGLIVRITWATGQIDFQGGQITFYDSTQLSVNFNLGFAPGDWTAKVINPDGQTSNTAPFAVVIPGMTTTYALPQFIFGGSWYTALYFSNTTNSVANFQVNFLTNNGGPLNTPLVGIGTVPSRSISLNPGATVVLEALDGGTQFEGWAEVSLPPGVVGYAVFRQVVAGRANQEAVVLLTPESSQTADFSYDDILLTTSVAFLNPSNQQVTLTITVYDINGAQVGITQVVLPPRSKQSAVLKNLPGLFGMFGNRGRALFSVPNGAISVLALRFGGEAFTLIPVNHR